jgi:hypothetical protein
MKKRSRQQSQEAAPTRSFRRSLRGVWTTRRCSRALLAMSARSLSSSPHPGCTFTGSQRRQASRQKRASSGRKTAASRVLRSDRRRSQPPRPFLLHCDAIIIIMVTDGRRKGRSLHFPPYTKCKMSASCCNDRFATLHRHTKVTGFRTFASLAFTVRS